MKYAFSPFSRLTRSAILVGALVGFLGLSGCGEGEDRQASYLKRAQDHYAEENYDKASVDARNVLQINPKNIEARVILADIAFGEGNLRRAFGSYSAIIEEQSDNVAALTGLSKIYAAVRDFQQSLDHADRALLIEPENSELMGFKALAMLGLEKSNEAYELAQQAIAIDAGNAAALGVTTQYLSGQEKFKEALDALTKGQVANPDDARLSMMKVGVYQALNDNAGLEQELVGLAAQFPDSVQYSDTLVRFYVRESEHAKAEEAIRRFAQDNPESYEAKRRVIQYLLQQESQDSAIAQAREYMQADEEDTRLINTLAEVYLFTGDKPKGMEVLQQSIATDPESVGAIEARTRLVQLFLADEDMDSARQMIGDILAIEPENEFGLMSRAGLHLNDRKLKDAIIDLRTVVKNNPENRQALSALAQTQEANGSVDLALDNYKKLMALGDTEIQTLASAARLAIQTEQYQEAEKYIRLALQAEEQSNNPRLVTDLVRLLALKEDWAAAQEFAQRLIDSDSAKALGYYLKGGIQQQIGEDGEAISSFKAALAEQPDAIETMAALTTLISEKEGLQASTAFIDDHCKAHASAPCLYILGTLNAQGQNFEAAEASLKESLNINDQFVRSYTQLARVYVAKQDLAGYETTLLDGISKTDNRSLKFDLATYYYGSQSYEQAAEIYRGIIDKASGKALAAKNNLAMIYAENLPSPENMKKARALVADLQESENAAYLDTVGWVSYLSGDYDTAITYIRAAVDKLGSAAILQYHLGMAYFKAGDSENARQHLTLATAEVESPYPGYDEAIETLQSL